MESEPWSSNLKACVSTHFLLPNSTVAAPTVALGRHDARVWRRHQLKDRFVGRERVTGRKKSEGESETDGESQNKGGLKGRNDYEAVWNLMAARRRRVCTKARLLPTRRLKGRPIPTEHYLHLDLERKAARSKL